MSRISEKKRDQIGRFAKDESGRTNVPVSPTVSPVNSTRATTVQKGSSVSDAFSLLTASKLANQTTQPNVANPARALVESLTALETFTDRFHNELDELDDNITTAKTSFKEEERAQLPILEARRQTIHFSLILAQDDIARATAMIDDDPFATHTSRVVMANENLAWTVRALAEKIEISEAHDGDQGARGNHQRAITHANAALARVRSAAGELF